MTLTGEGGAEEAGNVIAVVSGKGAPGKTTVAIGLAAALGERGRRVVLVDADLRGGNVGAYLDLDPRRGLFGLAYGADGASAGGSRTSCRRGRVRGADRHRAQRIAFEDLRGAAGGDVTALKSGSRTWSWTRAR